MKCLIVILLLHALTATTMVVGAMATSTIPLPAKMDSHNGAFRLDIKTRILVDVKVKEEGQYLAKCLRRSTGFSLPILEGVNVQRTRCDICLELLDSAPQAGSESYKLQVTPESVVIRAFSAAGIFYGIQTLLQLLPPEVFADKTESDVNWTIPCVEIEDEPRFKWRGSMLDVSRHFFNKQEVKRILDLMAMHKMNMFHWHLVDDQGWRIEIKKYPKLTEVGAWRQSIGFDLDPQKSTAYGPDGKYGGFYTQSDIREIVAYAEARHITIVPEIEMPGHSVAALEAYPEISCTGGPLTVETNLAIYNGIYCAGNEKTYEFLSNVLEEVMELFPGKYIHIGGDEVPKNNWRECTKCQTCMKKEGLKTGAALQSYFLQRIERIINNHRRKMIGWSEISEGGLVQNSAIMDWVGGATQAASAGHDVVIASHRFTYLCYYQSLDRPPNLQAFRPYLSLGKVYSLEPLPVDLPLQYSSHILGVEACLWTPYFSSINEIEEMSYPRLCALAEVAWSPKSSRRWDDFECRLNEHRLRLDQCGVNYWRDRSVRIGTWKPKDIKIQEGVLEWDVTKQITAPGKIRVSLNFLEGEDGLQINWAELLEDGHQISRDSHVGFTGTESHDKKSLGWNYILDLPSIKREAHYSVRFSVKGDGGTNSSGVAFMEITLAESGSR